MQSEFLKRFGRQKIDKPEGNGRIFVGKNDSYTAYWNCSDQCYYVYKEGRLMTTKHSRKEIECYLN